jgi:hypothetical protein
VHSNMRLGDIRDLEAMAFVEGSGGIGGQDLKPERPVRTLSAEDDVLQDGTADAAPAATGFDVETIQEDVGGARSKVNEPDILAVHADDLEHGRIEELNEPTPLVVVIPPPELLDIRSEPLELDLAQERRIFRLGWA